MLECLQRLIAFTSGIFFPNVGTQAESGNNDEAQADITEEVNSDEEQRIHCDDEQDIAEEQLATRRPVEFNLMPLETLHIHSLGLSENYALGSSENYV